MLDFNSMMDLCTLATENDDVINMIRKIDVVKKNYDVGKIKCRPDGSRYYYLLDRSHQVSAKTKAELIDKLYERCKYDTFLSLYNKKHCYDAELELISPKSLKEHQFLFNAIKDDPIMKMDITKVTAKEWREYFERITKGRALTKSRFRDIKSLINTTLNYGVEEGILEQNCLYAINVRHLKFKQVERAETYTDEDRAAIITYNATTLYELAIQFQFETALRIGEIKALTINDIEGGYVHIDKFMDDKNIVQQHVKADSAMGVRDIVLTDRAKQIVKMAKNMDSGDFLFGKLTTVTYNRHLKKLCEELNITYRSSHKIRANVLSVLSETMTMPEVQTIAGHTTIAMTQRYMRNTKGQELAEKRYKQALASTCKQM